MDIDQYCSLFLCVLLNRPFSRERRCVPTELLFNCGALVAEPTRKLKIRISSRVNFW